MSAWISTRFFRVDAIGGRAEQPAAGAFFGVPQELLTVQYWMLKTGLEIALMIDADIYWCADSDSVDIKSKVVKHNIELLETFATNTAADIEKYQANPALAKLDTLKNTPVVYAFLYAATNSNQSGIVGQYAETKDVAPFIYALAKSFYDTHGRLPSVLFDEYESEPRLLNNDPRGEAFTPETRFASDSYGIKCPMWAFVGACQVNGIVHFTDGGQRFVSEAAYFQFQFSLWAQSAPFSGLYNAPAKVTMTHGLLDSTAPPAYGEQIGAGSNPYAHLTVDFMGGSRARMYGPMLGFSPTLRADTYREPYSAGQTGYPAIHYVNGYDYVTFYGGEGGSETTAKPKYTASYPYRRYLTTVVPIVESVARLVGQTYGERLRKLDAEFLRQRAASLKETWVGLLTFILTAITLTPMLAGMSGLMSGNFSIGNLTQALKFGNKFGADTGSVTTLLSFGNNLYALGDKAVTGLSNFSQAAIDNQPELLEDAAMWDEFDFDGSGGTGHGGDWWTGGTDEWWDTGWVDDTGFVDWSYLYTDVPTVADALPGLTPAQIAATNGASTAEIAAVTQAAQAAQNSTDYWGTFQNLLKGAGQTAMQIGGLVMQYKQAELAFEKLKGGTTAMPQYATRPTQVGVPVRQPDGSISTLNPNGTITTVRPDGSIVATGANSPLPNFSTLFTPKNLMIGGAVIGVGVLGYFAFRSKSGRRR